MSARDRAGPVVLGIDLGTSEVKAGTRHARWPPAGSRPGRTRRTVDRGHRAGRSRIPTRGGRGLDAVRALASGTSGEVVAVGVDGHGPTLVAVDARARRPGPAITWLDTRGRRGRATSPPRPASEAGRWAVSRRRSGWSATSRRAAAATRWYLADLGVAGIPPDRARRAPLVPDQLVPDPRSSPPRRSRPTSCRRRPDRGSGRRLTCGRGGCARAAGRDPGRRRDGRRLRELPRCRPAPSRRRLRPRRFGRRLRRVLGSTGRGRRRLRRAGAAGRPVQRRRRDGGDRPGPRLVPRRDPRRPLSTESCSPRPPPPRPAPTASSSCRTSPASARRSGTRRPAASSPA